VGTAVTPAVDPAWKGLYRLGGISLIVGPLILIPELFLLFTGPPQTSGTSARLTFLASNKLGFITFIGIFILRDTLFIIGILALYFALKGVNRTYMLIANVLMLIGTVSEIGVGATFNYVQIALGDSYAAATTDAQKAAYVASADLAIGVVSSVVSLQGIFFVAAIIIISLVMLKGIFHKILAYVGIVLGIVSFVGGIAGGFGPPPFSIIGILALTSFSILGFIWLPIVGYKLYKLGR
jgi:hypothetical protein